MALQKQVSFIAPTTYNDGTTPLPTPDALSFNILIDTVNPPVKSYPVPAAQTPGTPGATVSVTFAQLGFTPVGGTVYWASATATDAAGTSAETTPVSFLYELAPAAPTGFAVA